MFLMTNQSTPAAPAARSSFVPFVRCGLFLALACATTPAWAQKQANFRWVNPLAQDKYPHLKHATFPSKLVKQDVGYCIYLPPSYSQETSRRYPVVYYLHGGRPGNETKSAALSTHIHQAMGSGDVPQAIYVLVNGGEDSH